MLGTMTNNRDNAKLHRPHFLVLLLLLSGLAMAPGLADATGVGPASTAWPMFQHDQRHTGLSPYVGAQDNTTRWVYFTNSGFKGSAVIGSDGTIYFNSYGTNMKLFALNPDGSLKWSRDTGHCYGSPAIGSDGTIYVAAVPQLYAYNPDGSLKWSFTPPQIIYGSPVIGDDGTIYCGADGGTTNGSLYAIRDNGTSGAIKWSYPCGKIVNSAPAIGNGGTIYIGTVYNNLHAITDAGDHYIVKWVFTQTSGSMKDSPPAIGADGTIYIGTDNSGSLFAVTDNVTNGVKKWQYDTGWSIQSSPAIGSDGTIYVGCGKAFGYPWSLHAINPDGSRKWTFDAGDDTASSSPVVSSDGTIYIGNGFQNTIKAISDNGTSGVLKWSYVTGGWVWDSATIASDGTVYIGSYDSNFYAFNNRPLVTTVSPASGTQGQTLTVTITGCQFTGATAVSFGAGITVNTFHTDNTTQITANITIAPGAIPGARDVTVTTPEGTGTKTGCFTVNVAPTPTPTPTPTPPNPLIGTGGQTSHGGSSGTGATSTITLVSLPNIQTQSATISAKTVTPGTPVTVTANIANKSTVNGNKKVMLYVNGQVEAAQGVTVNSGGSTQLTFNVSRSEPGDYTVYVDGVPAGSFKVELFRESDGILIFSAIMLAAAFGVGMIVLRRRQQRAG
jgi:outer membrane protein assembly factor BamB